MWWLSSLLLPDMQIKLELMLYMRACGLPFHWLWGWCINLSSVIGIDIICPEMLFSWWGDGKVLREGATGHVNLIMGHREHQSMGQCPGRGSPILPGGARSVDSHWVDKIEGLGEQDVSRTGRGPLLPKYLLSTWEHIMLQRWEGQHYSQKVFNVRILFMVLSG